MSGLICHSIRVAILQYSNVPTTPAQIPQFDRELRALFSNPVIAQSLADDPSNPLPQAIAILAKPTWTIGDRTTLYDMIESLYE